MSQLVREDDVRVIAAFDMIVDRLSSLEVKVDRQDAKLRDCDALFESMRDFDETLEPGRPMNGVLHCGQECIIYKHYQEPVTDPGVPIVAYMPDRFVQDLPNPFGNATSTSALIKELEELQEDDRLWIDDRKLNKLRACVARARNLTRKMTSHSERLFSLGSVNESDDGQRADNQTTSMPRRRLTCDDVGYDDDTSHRFFEYLIYETLLKVRFPQLLALGPDCVMFTMPEAGAKSPQRTQDIMDVVLGMHAALGVPFVDQSADQLQQEVLLFRVAPGLIKFYQAAIRAHATPRLALEYASMEDRDRQAVAADRQCEHKFLYYIHIPRSVFHVAP